MSILVTGAAGGIGAAIVDQLVEQGHDVVAHDLRPTSTRSGVTPIVGDLLADGFAGPLGDALGDAPLEAVIAAHGVDGSGTIEDLDDAKVSRILQINTATVARLYQSLCELLERHGGTFVVIASQAGLYAEPKNAAYCASKSALVAWVKDTAPRAATRGVAVRALCPGCTETPLLLAAHERFAAAEGRDFHEVLDARRRSIPIGRFADVTETAAAAVYLAARDHRPSVLAVTGGEVLG